MKKRMNKIISLITKNKRKVVLLTIIFLMIFTSAFIYINLTNPTKINSMIASVVNKGAPANKAFEDENFYKAVVDAYNKENKTSLPYTTNLTDEQLKTITSISYSGYDKPSNEKIISAKGLEKLTNLTYLSLYSNNISKIDVSNNTALTTLNLNNNYLSSIDVSKNTALINLYLSSNNISSIDVSTNTSLTSLDLSSNNLSSIDVSTNTALTTLNLTNNYLSSIDLSTNTALTTLYLRYNNISSIVLHYGYDTLKLEKDFGTQYSNQTNINLGNNKEIKPVDDYKYYLGAKLVIPSEIDINTFKENLRLNNLTAKIYTGKSEKTTGQVKQDDILKIYDGDNLIQDIPINIMFSSYFEDDVLYKAIVDAYNKENKTSLPYTTNLTDEQLSTITRVNYSGYDKPSNEKIASVKGLEKLTNLTYLNLDNNYLSSIDVSKNTALKFLYLDNNNLTNIDVSTNIALKDLRLYYNNLSSIDVSKNTALTTLDLSFNNISSIDVSTNTALTHLYLSDNNLSSIDLSNNPALTYLYLHNNSLSLGEYRLIKGTVMEGNSVGNVKLPEQFPITYEMEDSDIATYEDGTIKGLKSGTTSLKATLKGIKASSSSDSEDLVVEGTIKVFDIKSDKYEINKEDKYIYTKNDSDSSTIMKNITVENGTGKIENNIFKVMDGDVVVEEYKIVSVSSSKYDLSKDNIRIGKDETFDLDNIKVTNAAKEYSNGKLYIKYGNEVIKTYTVSSRLKGDINNDDKITIIDVSMLYRHIKKRSIITDQETLLISDINNDGKITIMDVSLLYRYVKGKINEL